MDRDKPYLEFPAGLRMVCDRQVVRALHWFNPMAWLNVCPKIFTADQSRQKPHAQSYLVTAR